jgi:arsenate reductase (thioredoxin)
MTARVLFLCTGNSARSLLAEALLKSLGGADYEVHSAGVAPRGVNPYTIQVLERQGITPDGLRSKNVAEFEGQDFDYVITVCDSAAEQCPVFSGSPRRIHWSLADPAAVEGPDAQKLAAFEQTLAQLKPRIQAFVEAPEPA